MTRSSITLPSGRRHHQRWNRSGASRLTRSPVPAFWT
jgi:hypothetical protein